MLARGGLLEQRPDLVAVELEALLQQGFELAPLRRVDRAVDHRSAHQERRRGEPKKTYGDVRFEWVRLRDDSGETTNVFFSGEPFSVELGLVSKIASPRLEVLCTVKTLEGVHVTTLMTGPLLSLFGYPLRLRAGVS